ncbi:LysR family transcriptional regulator, partial [Rhizobiaceae sp. 2RAB30]
MTSLRYDLVDLRLFVNIAEAANLTRGAERSNLSVGAASMRMKSLEEALDTQLFIRKSQGISLTPAGEALLTHALRVFQELERLHGELQTFSHGLKGQVRIFANTTAITGALPAALGRFLASHPLVDVDLEERLSPEIARAVAE